MSLLCDIFELNFNNCDVSNIFGKLISYIDVASDFMYYFSIVNNNNVFLWQKNLILSFAIIGGILDFLKCCSMFNGLGEYLDGNEGLANNLFTKWRTIFSLLIVFLEDIPQFIFQTMIEIQLNSFSIFYLFSIILSSIKIIWMIIKSTYIYVNHKKLVKGETKTIKLCGIKIINIENMPKNNHTSEIIGVTYKTTITELCGCKTKVYQVTNASI
jgi:hypothetical protein